MFIWLLLIKTKVNFGVLLVCSVRQEEEQLIKIGCFLQNAGE